jgi:hypothetical protein
MSYTYYATELALKLFMTAEKFMVFHTALFTFSRWPICTTHPGHKGAVMCRKASGRGTSDSLQLALNQRWSGPQMTGPQGTVAYSRLPAGWREATQPGSVSQTPYESDFEPEFLQATC